MLAHPFPSPVDELARAADSLDDLLAHCSDAEAAHHIMVALNASDRLMSLVVRALAARGGLEHVTGLPTEQALMLDGRRTKTDARALTQTADALRAMPRTAELFARGEVSWPQARAIGSLCARVDATERGVVDDLVARAADELAAAEPDELVWRVAEAVDRLRPDLARAREDRAIEGRFLSLQQRLGGGGTLYGEADAESFATICAAVDAAAEAPVDPDEPGAPSRAAQRMDALVSICEDALSGTSGGSTRPQPRLIATLDIAAFAEAGLSEGARVLWALAGGPARLTPLSTEVLACDASWVQVLTDGARPVAVGDAQSPISTKLRTALVARDQGCRFPTCAAPANWTDAHHITNRADGGTTDVGNLVLLCRRHHRLVHRRRWRIAIEPDGAIGFTWRGKRHVSPPRLRTPQRE